MYIVIVGAGEVGSYLAGILVEEQHDVAIVERDQDLVRHLESSLDALVVQGTGIDQKALAQAGIRRADLLLAVTQIDEVNLVTCMVAARMGKNLSTVARVRASEYLGAQSSLNAEDLGLSLLVGPEHATASKVVDLLQFEGAGSRRDLADGRLVLLEMPLGNDSPFVHETLAELNELLGDQSLVCGVMGRDGLRIPRGSDKLAVEERAYILTVPDSVDMFMILSGKPWHQVRHVLIVGCGTIGLQVAKHLERLQLFSTIIEKDAARAAFVAKQLSKATVLHGDGTDPDFLREELEEVADAVVVLLEDDEKALLVGLFAKHLGAKKVIVRSDKRAYAQIAHKLGIDALISPQRAVADAILQFIHSGQIASAHMLGDHEGEIMELHVGDEARVKNKALREIDFPPGSLVGAVIRDGEVSIASGDTVLRAGDDLLVVALPTAIPKIEKLFSA